MQKWFYGLILLIMMMSGIWWGVQERTPLKDSVLRLHVIANSDSPADQALKLQVKNRVVEMMQAEFEAARDVQEARKLALQKKPAIEKAAREVITSNGYNYPVQVAVGDYEFPTKTYGNLVLPQGEYQAVRVIIGEGQGKNWWCVLFPPLCMVSSSDQGLSLGSSKEAEISFKCLELLPQGARISRLHKNFPARQNHKQP